MLKTKGNLRKKILKIHPGKNNKSLLPSLTVLFSDPTPTLDQKH
jgi:hypothetical protein